MAGMEFLIGGFLIAIIALLSRNMRAPQLVQLGSVSQQWLAEYRASHPGR